MRVTVDGGVCGGHGDCVLAAPAVFELRDDDEVVSVLSPEPPEELREAVRDAAGCCPTGAIQLTG